MPAGGLRDVGRGAGKFRLQAQWNLTLSENIGIGSGDLGSTCDSRQAYVLPCPEGLISYLYGTLPAIIVVNVLNYYAPLRAQLIKAAEVGFINPVNIGFITFVDGPADEAEHADYDWGSAVIEALKHWKPVEWEGYGLDWTKANKKDAKHSQNHAVGSTYSRL